MEHKSINLNAIKKSWQSFSTMKRFVSEANRLENASWRLWYIHKNQSSHGLSCNEESIETSEEVEYNRTFCVYCEMHIASLSCNGCCHDAYCVSCFKLIHKKGNLATHTAIKIIKEQKPRSKAPTNSVSPQADNTEKFMLNSTSKPWEIQMDMLMHRLMANSLHNERDISVHNIDDRASLLNAESLFPGLLSTEGEESRQINKIEKKDSEYTFDNGLSVGNSKKKAVICSNCSGSHTMIDCPLLVESFQLSAPMHLPNSSFKSDHFESTDSTCVEDELMSTKNSSQMKSRKKAICANCKGNHLMVECPKLMTAFSPEASKSHGAFDRMLRKCFTTIHNDNMSNSTHAFLGDEISVRGGSLITNQRINVADFKVDNHMNTIHESVLDIHPTSTLVSKNSSPILIPVEKSSTDRKWTAASWLMSSLASDLPPEVYSTLRNTHLSCNDTSHEHSVEAFGGWAYVSKRLGGIYQWERRYLTLYRNHLWEYLDNNETIVPIGFANLTEGKIAATSFEPAMIHIQYLRHSLPDSPYEDCFMRFDEESIKLDWEKHLSEAMILNISKLFDLEPSFESSFRLTRSSSSCDANVYELGKGRFSEVRLAKRSSACYAHEVCALKIINKTQFWDLVVSEVERDDTIVREILTQSLLTAKSGSSYCPVIRLLSLFETRTHLVMELELMQEGDLHEEIATNNAVTEARASFLVASLVKAVEFCQKNGVAHRDVKLSNLALSSEGRFSILKIADFGMASFIRNDGTLKGRCGTPGFVAPEILTAGKGESYPSCVDMFSVGVVMYTMLCGYEPFFGVSDEELISMNKMVKYEFEEPEWSSISATAKELISLMMEKDTNKRITPQQALQHPFLKDAAEILDQILPEDLHFCKVRLL